MFLAKGELIDEAGTIYQGQQEIKALVTAFIAKFPGSQMKNEIESIRIVGPVAIQEGRRVTTATDGSSSTIRYICVLSQTDQGGESHRFAISAMSLRCRQGNSFDRFLG